MALDAIDFAEARGVPRDFLVAEKHASAGDEDCLGAIASVLHAQHMIDLIATQRPVWERNELRLIIASGVNRSCEVDVDGDNAIVWC